MTDQEIEDFVRTSGGQWDGDHWVFEDADLHPFVRALAAHSRQAQSQQEPVNIAAVAEVIEGEDGLSLSWSLEGGICELAEGCVLLVADRPVTDDTGHGEIYTTPQAAQPTVAVSDGFVLVPIEPTHSMLQAGKTSIWISIGDSDEHNLTLDEAFDVYRAMLAAAPGKATP